MKPQRIIIVGGSIGGLFAAVLLHRAGFDVTVYERSVHGLEGRGAGLVAQQEVFAILREVGLEHNADIGVLARERIYLDRDDRIIRRMHMPQSQLSWDVLFRSFRDLLPNKSYMVGRQVIGASEDAGAASVQFADGDAETADLIIGADGIGSALRAAVVGPHSLPSYVGYATWRGLAPEQKMPEVSAAQLSGRFAFCDSPGSHILGYLVPGSDGSVTPGRRRYNWVWYRRYTANELEAVLTDVDGHRRPYSLAPGRVRPEVVAAMRQDAETLLPPSFRAIVEAAPQPFVHAIFDYAAPRMTTRRIALMGDAAFVARPHTAMGVAKAAGDALALRDALTTEEQLSDALAAYEAERAPIDRAVVAYGRDLGRSID